MNAFKRNDGLQQCPDDKREAQEGQLFRGDTWMGLCLSG